MTSSLRRLPPWALWLACAGLCVAVALGVAATALIARDVRIEAKADAAASTEDLEGARLTLVDRFPDAEEISFGQAFVHGDDEARAVCGRVDIKQSDDGFDGEERFIYVLGGLTLEETDGSAAITQKWKDVCEG